jgi:WD40 repeat protein
MGSRRNIAKLLAWFSGIAAVALIVATALKFRPQATLLFTDGRGGGRVAWSRDGSRLLISDHRPGATIPDTPSPSGRGTISYLLVLDVSTRNVVTTTATRLGGLRSLAWSPDGRLFAGADRKDGVVKIWDTLTGEERASLAAHGPGEARSADWNPDGALLATGGEDRTVKIWDTRTYQLVSSHALHQAVVGSVAWSVDGKRLASAGWDQTILIMDHRSGNVLHSLWRQGPSRSRPDGQYSLAWSPEGERLASADSTGTVSVWDTRSGALVFTAAKLHTANCRSVDWSPGGCWLASGSDDGTVRILEAASGKHVLTLPHGEKVGQVAWSPGGGKLATAAGKDLRVWDVSSLSRLSLFY